MLKAKIETVPIGTEYTAKIINTETNSEIKSFTTSDEYLTEGIVREYLDNCWFSPDDIKSLKTQEFIAEKTTNKDYDKPCKIQDTLFGFYDSEIDYMRDIQHDRGEYEILTELSEVWDLFIKSGEFCPIYEIGMNISLSDGSLWEILDIRESDRFICGEVCDIKPLFRWHNGMECIANNQEFITITTDQVYGIVLELPTDDSVKQLNIFDDINTEDTAMISTEIKTEETTIVTDEALANRPVVLPWKHTDFKTAYIIEDYPYGRTLRCKKAVWLETATKGAQKGKMRSVYQTTNPKHKGNSWNTPKPSQYTDLKFLYIDPKTGYLEEMGLSTYSPDEIARWKALWYPLLDSEQQKAVDDLEKVSIALNAMWKNVTFETTVLDPCDAFSEEEEEEETPIAEVTDSEPIAPTKEIEQPTEVEAEEQPTSEQPEVPQVDLNKLLSDISNLSDETLGSLVSVYHESLSGKIDQIREDFFDWVALFYKLSDRWQDAWQVFEKQYQFPIETEVNAVAEEPIAIPETETQETAIAPTETTENPDSENWEEIDNRWDHTPTIEVTEETEETVADLLADVGLGTDTLESAGIEVKTEDAAIAPIAPTIEYISGQESHSSTWAKFYVKGLDQWAVREKDDEPASDNHASFSQFVCLNVPIGTVFTIFEQDGDKRGTDSFNFWICKISESKNAIKSDYKGIRHCTGNFEVICQGLGKTKAPRLMDWWKQTEGMGSEEKLCFALHCQKFIEQRGIKELPPIAPTEEKTNLIQFPVKETETAIAPTEVEPAAIEAVAEVNPIAEIEPQTKTVTWLRVNTHAMFKALSNNSTVQRLYKAINESDPSLAMQLFFEETLEIPATPKPTEELPIAVAEVPATKPKPEIVTHTSVSGTTQAIAPKPQRQKPQTDTPKPPKPARQPKAKTSDSGVTPTQKLEELKQLKSDVDAKGKKVVAEERGYSDTSTINANLIGYSVLEQSEEVKRWFLDGKITWSDVRETRKQINKKGLLGVIEDLRQKVQKAS